MTRRLLFLTPQLPYPPRQGTAIRNWGLISHLAKRNAVSLLSFVEAGQDSEPELLRTTCQHLVTVPAPRRSKTERVLSWLRGEADLGARLWSASFEPALRTLLDTTTFDFVHLEGLEMARYLDAVRAAAPKAHILYDAHNAEHVLQQRAFRSDLGQGRRWPAAAYSWQQAPRLARFEARVCRAAAGVVCVSREDAYALQRLVSELKPLVVPNGIDLADYARAGARPTEMSNGDNLVFTGKMDYRPNVDAALWFADEILPRIRAARPNASFLIVGQKPAASLTRRHGQDGVSVTGAVADARPYIGHARVYVAPLRMGGGTRFKLLEAMALARPVVSTTLGAEGFQVQSGRELLLANDEAAFAEAVLALLADPARSAALGQAGRAFVEDGYDWTRLIPRLDALYSRMESHVGWDTGRAS